MPIVVVPCLGSRMWSLQSPNINPKNWSQWFSKRNLPQNRTLRLTWGRAIIIIIIIIIIVIVIINITRYYTTPRCDSVCVSPLSHRVSLFWSLTLVTMYGSKRKHHSASQTLSQAVHPVANTSSILTFWLRTGTTYVLYSLVVLNYYYHAWLHVRHGWIGVNAVSKCQAFQHWPFLCWHRLQLLIDKK